jgi:cyclic-di-GMP-binding protein
MPSFDIVAEVDLQEVDNAINQARKEIETRYDFKGSKCSIDYDKNATITLVAEDSMKLRSVSEILNQKMAKRGISLKSLEYKETEKASGDTIRQDVVLKQGIKTDDAKRIVKAIKEGKLKKVQGQIQGEQVRVSGPKRDDLQEAIQLVKSEIPDLDLQFTNFRD